MDRFRVALLGTSFARLVQAPAFQRHPGFDLVAIAGARPERTREVAAELGVPGAYGDWRELIAKEKPDLVSIATPVDLHHPMMLAALEAGCHVHCEKPTALNAAQAIEMRDAARRAKRVAGINHEFRFLPARALALELVRKGEIGRPRRAEILGRYPSWQTVLGRAMNWLADASRGGGILGALGSHHTDALRLFLGEPRRVLASVRVDQPRRGAPAPGAPEGVATADDAFTLQYAFDHGATALVDLNAHAPYRWERYEVEGEEATLRWDDDGHRLWQIAPGKEPEELEIPERLRLDRREGDPPLVAPFSVMVDRLWHALKGLAPMEPDFGDAVAVQLALDAARRSSAEGREVAVAVAPA